jgi:hypothetical protein
MIIGRKNEIYDLLNIQHVFIYLIPAFLAVIVVALALGYTHLKSVGRGTDSFHEFPEGLRSGRAPFPMALILIIAGTVVWVLGYILLVGLVGVRI